MSQLHPLQLPVQLLCVSVRMIIWNARFESKNVRDWLWAMVEKQLQTKNVYEDVVVAVKKDRQNEIDAWRASFGRGLAQSRYGL